MVKIKRAMLVYQGGLANVFEVKSFNVANDNRNAKRLLQHTFGPCQWYAHGLGSAGTIVRTVGCNMAGDIINEKWTEDLDTLPFSDKFNPVHMN